MNFIPDRASSKSGWVFLPLPTIILRSLSAIFRHFRHALMLDPKNIVQVLWDPSSATGSSSAAKAKGKKRGVDRSKLAPSGKGKKGGLPMLPETRICIVRDSDGTEHIIRAGIRATLLEVNDERLAQEPNLMRTAADNHGFIAILMPPMGGDWRNTNIPKQFNGMEEMRDSDRRSTEMELKECKEQL
uniref:Protein Abitram n=1 Tax=Globodera rostochiensis TaxID=31243 RepID=A0A914I759_GLORO